MDLKTTPRKTFIDRKNHFVHPSSQISDPRQLVGREAPLKELRDCFETKGLHAFIWGLRGVGKTSLAHSACEKYDDSVVLAAAIGCEKNSTSNELLKDVFRRVVNGGKVNLSGKTIKAKIAAFGFSVEGSAEGFQNQLSIGSVNHASDFLNTILPADHEENKEWVIIIDEFDQLKNTKTIDFFTSLAKQMSVDNVSIKFIFCGVASNLNELIGSHESVDRYLKAVDLNPLLSGNIIDISKDIAEEFSLTLSSGQLNRIAQIACGYPHFAHVIMNEILNVAFEEKFERTQISATIYKEGVQSAAKGAATRLRKAYEDATRRGTDKYIEVLWATADGQLMTKQFKTIKEDYDRIILEQNNREGISKEQNLRNHLNELCKGDDSVLIREKTGWYSFREPMLRSYVRMMAHNNGIDLGDESFKR